MKKPHTGTAATENKDGLPAVNNNKDSGKKSSGRSKALTIVGIILCVVFLPILILNIILIIQGFSGDKSKVPNIGGYFPLMVETGSMEPTIMTGDLIIVHTIDNADDLKVGDIVTYWDNQPGGTLITHRIAEVTKDDAGKTAYRTKGDGNPVEDGRYLYPDRVVGVYVNRFAGMGKVAMFMQTVPGLIICVVLPLMIFVIYDVIRRRRISKAGNAETAALMAELEALKKQQAQRELESGNSSASDPAGISGDESKNASEQKEEAPDTKSPSEEESGK